MDCCILGHSGNKAEDTLRNLNPVSSHAVIKGKHLLVDKLISTQYECRSRIPLVAVALKRLDGLGWVHFLFDGLRLSLAKAGNDTILAIMQHGAVSVPPAPQVSTLPEIKIQYIFRSLEK